jgi:hypothetical protein
MDEIATSFHSSRMAAANIPVVVPNCKWAQRNDRILFSIVIPNLDQSLAKVSITETSFSFQVKPSHSCVRDFAEM